MKHFPSTSILLIAFSLFVFSLGCARDKVAKEPDAGKKSSGGSSKEAEDVVSEPESGSSERQLSPLVFQYEPAAEVLQLDAAQVARIDAIHKQFGEELLQWHQSDGKAMRELQQKALQAARNRDLGALNRLNASGAKEKVAQFKEAERDIAKRYASKLLDAIPDDKLDQWKAHRISTCLLDFLEPLSLEEEQKEQIRELAPDAVRSVRSKPNWQGYGTSQLEKLFEQKVLTAEQKDAFEKLKSKNRLRMLKWNN